MKKLLLLVLLTSAFTFLPSSQSEINATSHDYDNIMIAASDGWTIVEVPCYDDYGRRIAYASVEVAMRRTSNGYEYKARKAGFRYDNDEWFPVRRGNYRCGDMTCHYKVEQWGSTFYFNL